MRALVIERIYIASGSMEPVLKVGQTCWVDKLSLRYRLPKRGEIIIFNSPVEPGRGLGKRVIGLPGDQVELRQKRVFINDRELSEPYAVHRRDGERLVGDTMEPIVVPSGELFVLGDNRDESEDSSVWKDASGRPVHFIKLTDVVGLVRVF